MAVENCTVSTQSITALGGSTLVAGTKTLIITPDAGFVVAAAQCSVGNAMETFDGSNTWNTVGANVTTGITQVQFADVGDGTVEAIVTHGAISISNNTTDFLVDIDVSAALPPSFACIRIDVKHSLDAAGAVASSSVQLDVDGITEQEILNNGADHVVTSSGEVSSTVGTTNYIATIRQTAAAGFSFPTYAPTEDPQQPVFNVAVMGQLASNWSSTITNKVYNGDYIIQYDVNIFYETPLNVPEGIESAAQFCNLGHKVDIRTKSNPIPVARVMSYSVDGFNAEPLFGYHSQVRDVVAFGTPGSRFEIGVVDEDGGIYNFKTGVFSKVVDRTNQNYHEIPAKGIYRASVNYPSSLSAAKSYSYFVEGVTTPAKASIGGELGRTANLIEAGVTSLGSSVPTKGSLTSFSQKARQRVQLKVTQSASVHTIPSASSTGVSLFGVANETSPKKINIPDPDIPYIPVPESLYKVDFSLTCTLGTSAVGKVFRSTGIPLDGATLRYVYDANTITVPDYYISNGTVTSDYGDTDSIVFAGSLYVRKFGEVSGDGLYCLEIYIDNFVKEF